VTVPDRWSDGGAYERFMGRWSKPLAERFLAWLAPGPDLRWLDVGCGTGALAEAIVETASPAEVTGVDPSQAFVDAAAARLDGRNARFLVGDAQQLPLDDDEVDAAVSGLVLNFVADSSQAVAEMARVVRSGGLVGSYVWDYGDGMTFLREFWKAAAELDPRAAELDEGVRFPLTRRDGLAETFAAAALDAIETAALELPTHFADFDDFWSPFLGGVGAAPSYVASLDAEAQERLRQSLAARLPREADGSIRLTARAWAARGTPS
jgi:SAM-dependent methyltransferase